MVASKQATVSERRALLTDREREIIAGDADVADSYRYQTISRVRARFDRLEGDLQALEEHGELADEFRGIVCRTDADQSPPASARERTGVSGEESAAGASTSQSPADGESRSESAHGGERAPTLSETIDAVADDVLPGSGSKLEARREALHAVVGYLREHGTATPSDFQADVYPDHPARYTDGNDPPHSWWNNCMYKGLGAIADRTDAVERPDTSGDWTWIGGDGGDA